jgi:hypothetical protein
MAKFEDEFKGKLCFWGQFEEVFEGGIRGCVWDKLGLVILGLSSKVIRDHISKVVKSRYNCMKPLEHETTCQEF